MNFTVNEDLVINGQVVVRKGTPAIGSVINAEKGGYLGKSGKLGIQVESTQTIDGKPLKLRAAKGKEGNDKTNSTFALSMIAPFFTIQERWRCDDCGRVGGYGLHGEEKTFSCQRFHTLLLSRKRQS